DRLELHAGKSESAVAFDGDDWSAGLDGRADRVAHADAHDSPGAAVEPVPGQPHVNHVAGEAERVGSFVDDVGLRVCANHVAYRAQRTVELHRMRICSQ